jgi:hypothetical protein
LFAGPEFPPVPFVVRVIATPSTFTLVVAFTTVVPATADTRLTVQLPVVPTVVQEVGPTNAPGPDAIEYEIDVPAGAFAKPEPLPLLMLT